MKILDVPQSGSVAGVTSSRNRYGQYRRTRAIPVNPNTIYQQGARIRLQTFAAQWANLTSAQRDAWDAYAQSHPRSDSLGQTVVLAGFNMYMSAALTLSHAGLSVPSAPVLVAAGAQDALVTFAPAETAQAVPLTFTPPDAGFALEIQMGGPRSPGVEFESNYKRIVGATSASSSPIAAGAAYTARWGAIAEGQKIFLRSRVIDPNGLPGSWNGQVELVAA